MKFNNTDKGPWIASKPTQETRHISIKGYWSFPEPTKSCDHNCMYYSKEEPIPTCDDCGTQAIFLPMEEDLELEEDIIVSKITIYNTDKEGNL